MPELQSRDTSNSPLSESLQAELALVAQGAARVLKELGRARSSYQHKRTASIALRVRSLEKQYRDQRKLLCNVARSCAQEPRVKDMAITATLVLLRTIVSRELATMRLTERLRDSVMAEISCAVALDHHGLERWI